jgi:hypothetical protein
MERMYSIREGAEDTDETGKTGKTGEVKMVVLCKCKKYCGAGKTAGA